MGAKEREKVVWSAWALWQPSCLGVFGWSLGWPFGDPIWCARRARRKPTHARERRHLMKDVRKSLPMSKLREPACRVGISFQVCCQSWLTRDCHSVSAHGWLNQTPASCKEMGTTGAFTVTNCFVFNLHLFSLYIYIYIFIGWLIKIFIYSFAFCFLFCGTCRPMARIGLLNWNLEFHFHETALNPAPCRQHMADIQICLPPDRQVFGVFFFSYTCQKCMLRFFILISWFRCPFTIAVLFCRVVFFWVFFLCISLKHEKPLPDFLLTWKPLPDFLLWTDCIWCKLIIVLVSEGALFYVMWFCFLKLNIHISSHPTLCCPLLLPWYWEETKCGGRAGSLIGLWNCPLFTVT